jgi:hypothetical protein
MMHCEDDEASANCQVNFLVNDNNSAQVDFLTNKMKAEEAAAAKIATKSDVAPISTIEFSSTVIRDSTEETDEVSEMTRGSGLASGVSEVLDMDRHRNNKGDSFTILEDLARTY